MKNFNKNIIAVLLIATTLSGCGNSPKTPENSCEFTCKIQKR